MKKKNLNSKLSLNKETISNLTDEKSIQLIGGVINRSNQYCDSDLCTEVGCPTKRCTGLCVTVAYGC